MTKFPKIALGCTAAFGLLVGTGVTASADDVAVSHRLPADTTVTIPLDPVNASTASGVATMQETEEGQTSLEVEVHGAGAEGDPLLAFLVSGTCEEPGEVRAALGVVEADAEGDARGAFLLGDSLDEVLAVPSTLQVQPDGAEAGPVACGQFGEIAEDAFAEPTTTPIPEPIPADGDVEELEEGADLDENEELEEVAEDENSEEAAEQE